MHLYSLRYWKSYRRFSKFLNTLVYRNTVIPPKPTGKVGILRASRADTEKGAPLCIECVFMGCVPFLMGSGEREKEWQREIMKCSQGPQFGIRAEFECWTGSLLVTTHRKQKIWKSWSRVVFIKPVGHKKNRAGHYEVQSNLIMTDSPLGRDKHKKHTIEEELSCKLYCWAEIPPEYINDLLSLSFSWEAFPRQHHSAERLFK